MENATFNIKTEVFEGPLDLLLSLVEKRKLFINDISLSKVADDYIKHIQEFQNSLVSSGQTSYFPVSEITNFVVVASILILIKSKSLLPQLDITTEGQQNIEELEDRLKEYKKYKQLSVFVAERFGKNIIFPRAQISKYIQPIFTPDHTITKENILMVVLDTINRAPKPEKIPQQTVKKTISLEETIVNLTQRITQKLKMNFGEFSKYGKVEKITVVISFLAMLELVKQGTIIVKQENIFSEISMETQQLELPHYTMDE